MGAGIAFFFVRAQRTCDVRVIAAVGREVVIADAILTASAVVLQPVTGLAMVRLAGFPLSLPWLRWSIALYVFIGCCWLLVVWLQVQMRNLAVCAMQDRTALHTAYFRYYRWWFLSRMAGVHWSARRLLSNGGEARDMIEKNLSASIALYRHQATFSDGRPDGKILAAATDCYAIQMLVGAGDN
jgi:uncharacterized membrane protein